MVGNNEKYVDMVSIYMLYFECGYNLKFDINFDVIMCLIYMCVVVSFCFKCF